MLKQNERFLNFRFDLSLKHLVLLNIQSLFNKETRSMQQDKPEIIQINQTIINQNRQKSTYTSQYDAFFKDVASNCQSKSTLLAQLTNHGDIFAFEQSFDYLSIQLVNNSSNFEALRFQVRICYLSFQINVYNSNKKSPSHDFQNISCSHASSIYVNSYFLPKTVGKCSDIQQENFPLKFIRILKEFCMFKIAAILGVGPRLDNIFGFDIVIFKQCAEFCMEKCEPIKQLDQKTINLLKSKLKKLHTLKIVHLDIKPQNISFSPTLNEPVFLDFGFSDILDEDIGMKTKTFFVGTIGYNSLEMMECYNNQCASFVDVYYNDVYALEKSIQSILQQRKQEGYKDQSQQYVIELQKIKIKYLYQLILVKYLIYTNRPALLQDQSFLVILQKYKKQIIQFCLTLKYSQFLNKILQIIESNFSLEKLSKNVEKNHLTYQNRIIAYEKNDFQDEKHTKFSCFIHGIKIKRLFLTNQQLQIINPTKLKDMLLKEEVILTLKKQIYFEKMVLFLDHYSNLAKYQQRMQAARLMKTIYRINGTINSHNEYQDIILCLKYLLNFFILQQKQVSANLIPILWKNLLILYALGYDEAVRFFSKIINMKLSSRCLSLLLFRCFLEKQHQKFKQNDNSLQNNFLQKVMNMISDAIANISNDTVHQDSKFVNLIYKMIQLNNIVDNPSDLLNQTWHCFQYIQKQLEPATRRQLRIYLLSSQIRLCFLAGKENIGLKLIQTIKEIQMERNQYYIKFQYYHFRYCQLMYCFSDVKALASLYDALKECLDNQKLLKRYRIYHLRQTSIYPQIYFKTQKPLIWFQNFIKNSDLTNHSDRMTCLKFIFKIWHLIPASKNRIKQGRLKNIYSILRQKFPLQILQKLKDQMVEDFKGHKNVYRAAYIIIVAFCQIHQNNPQKFPTLQLFLQFLKQLWMKNDCNCCIQSANVTLVTIEGVLLREKKMYKEATQIYKRYIQSGQSNFNQRKIRFMIQIIDNFIQSKEGQRYYQNLVPQLEYVYEWIKKNNAWSHIVSNQRVHAFSIINHYLLLKQRYEQFIQVSYKYLEIINFYPSDNLIKIYMVQLIDFFFFAPMLKIKVWQMLDGQLLDKFKRNDYGVLFLVVELIELRYYYTQKYKKMLNIIFNKINLLGKSIRLIVLSHLYYLIFRKFTHKKCELKKLRQKRYYFKLFMRNKLSQIAFQDFSKTLIYLKKQKSLQKTKNLVINKYNSLLYQYYLRFNAHSIQMTYFHQYYPSPFDIPDSLFQKIFKSIKQENEFI